MMSNLTALLKRVSLVVANKLAASRMCLMISAGTKAFGDVQQTSSDGYVTVQFHTLRMPNGREEKIEGSAVSLDQKPLKGQVCKLSDGNRNSDVGCSLSP